jgi:hypothetical protein
VGTGVLLAGMSQCSPLSMQKGGLDRYLCLMGSAGLNGFADMQVLREGVPSLWWVRAKRAKPVNRGVCGARKKCSQAC